MACTDRSALGGKVDNVYISIYFNVYIELNSHKTVFHSSLLLILHISAIIMNSKYQFLPSFFLPCVQSLFGLTGCSGFMQQQDWSFPTPVLLPHFSCSLSHLFCPFFSYFTCCRCSLSVLLLLFSQYFPRATSLHSSLLPVSLYISPHLRF